jgi:hypothetical protein
MQSPDDSSTVADSAFCGQVQNRAGRLVGVCQYFLERVGEPPRRQDAKMKSRHPLNPSQRPSYGANSANLDDLPWRRSPLGVLASWRCPSSRRAGVQSPLFPEELADPLHPLANGKPLALHSVGRKPTCKPLMRRVKYLVCHVIPSLFRKCLKTLTERRLRTIST